MARFLRLTVCRSISNKSSYSTDIVLLNLEHIVAIQGGVISPQYPEGATLITTTSIVDNTCETYWVKEPIDLIVRSLPI